MFSESTVSRAPYIICFNHYSSMIICQQNLISAKLYSCDCVFFSNLNLLPMLKIYVYGTLRNDSC